ncbi:MAG TPA: hypothetical protein VN228_01595 [Pyrinomonadaceae bacterium]|nr:hypothetical protein [Pyrinomonadaceae bacterium]
MLKRLLTLALAVLLAHLAHAPAAAATKAEKEARLAEKVRAGIARLGTGREAVVELKLRDKTRLKGYVAEAGPDSFTVVDAGGRATRVSYPQVRQARGHNLSEGAKIAIGVGIIAAIIIIAVVAASSAS